MFWNRKRQDATNAQQDELLADVPGALDFMGVCRSVDLDFCRVMLRHAIKRREAHSDDETREVTDKLIRSVLPDIYLNDPRARAAWLAKKEADLDGTVPWDRDDLSWALGPYDSDKQDQR